MAKDKKNPPSPQGVNIGISDKDRAAIAALRNAVYACELPGVKRLS